MIARGFTTPASVVAGHLSHIPKRIRCIHSPQDIPAVNGVAAAPSSVAGSTGAVNLVLPLLLALACLIALFGLAYLVRLSNAYIPSDVKWVPADTIWVPSDLSSDDDLEAQYEPDIKTLPDHEDCVRTKRGVESIATEDYYAHVVHPL